MAAKRPGVGDCTRCGLRHAFEAIHISARRMRDPPLKRVLVPELSPEHNGRLARAVSERAE